MRSKEEKQRELDILNAYVTYYESIRSGESPTTEQIKRFQQDNLAEVESFCKKGFTIDEAIKKLHQNKNQ